LEPTAQPFTLPDMMENPPYESPQSVGHLEPCISQRLGILEMQYTEHTGEISLLKKLLTKLNSELLQERQYRQRAEIEIKSLQDQNVANAIQTHELKMWVEKAKKTAGDEELARHLQKNINENQTTAPQGQAPIQIQDTTPPSTLSPNQYPPLPQRTPIQNPTLSTQRSSWSGLSHIPITPNPFYVLAQQNSVAPNVQAVRARQQTPLNPTAPIYHVHPIPKRHMAPPTLRVPTSIPHPDQQEQDKLSLKLRVTGLATTSSSDSTSQVVSFFSEKLGLPTSDLKLSSVEQMTSTSAHFPSPLIVTCEDLDTKRKILRSKKILKGNTHVWIEPCMTQWQMTERRKKDSWLQTLRKQGLKAFFLSHSLMKIVDGKMMEVFTPPY
jgi:hypothetical protein